MTEIIEFNDVFGYFLLNAMRWAFEMNESRRIMTSDFPLDKSGNRIVRIGHSPDPDDAFMFHAMTTNAFPTPGYNFVHELQDIETLNHRAMNCEL